MQGTHDTYMEVSVKDDCSQFDRDCAKVLDSFQKLITLSTIPIETRQSYLQARSKSLLLATVQDAMINT